MSRTNVHNLQITTFFFRFWYKLAIHCIGQLTYSLHVTHQRLTVVPTAPRQHANSLRIHYRVQRDWPLGEAVAKTYAREAHIFPAPLIISFYPDLLSKVPSLVWLGRQIAFPPPAKSPVTAPFHPDPEINYPIVLPLFAILSLLVSFTQQTRSTHLSPFALMHWLSANLFLFSPA